MLIVLPFVLKENNINKVRLARVIYPNKLNFNYIYKKFCNFYFRTILKMTVVDSCIVTDDVEQLISGDGTIELMCHPYEEDSEIMDSHRNLSEVLEILRKEVNFELISYDQL
jgi:hypothetical protein